MNRKRCINIGLMGLGVVGSGVARILREKAQSIEQQIGCPLAIKRVLVREPNKRRPIRVRRDQITTNPSDILDDPEIDVVIEVIGGETPAYDFIRAAISAGKHVVTANKEVMAKHGPELLMAAQQKRVDIYFEASVGGGIPIIATFKQDLLANEISSIQAIINGTTNYILTEMSQRDTDFHAVLKQAQKLGYAEADPKNDVEGYDAAYKLSILASLAFHTQVKPEQVYQEGITKLAPRDFRYASELGYAIKLLAIAKEENHSIQARVHPAFIRQDQLLAQVNGVFNAVQVEGDLIGRMLFYGQGAGSLPTTSAVVADVIDLAHNINLGISNRLHIQLDLTKNIKPMSDIQTRYYIRLTVPDQAGVLAQIAKTLGDNTISIASVIQKEVDEAAQTAELVIMTHLAQEASVQKALSELKQLPVVREIGNFVRVEN